MQTIRKKPHRLHWLLFAMILATWLQTGCGQKGPLYFPDTATKEAPKNE
uniref:Lipoprotein-attachment site-containing protein n=1 Tax=Candidatus Kentrum sp. FW TaxID=2126338 RepID=A0A450U131_9GAMM|nr:MAG: hypothetical protein BECKFW1821C_GA0114237_10979 [Candidatus Kentron sp. FW]